jgi:eukaryotic-like serine/threonine-protein kinase
MKASAAEQKPKSSPAHSLLAFHLPRPRASPQQWKAVCGCATLTPDIGMHIGPYRLLQAIGKGGMGTVFLAERQHAVERRVALKNIKAGMDSRQVLARFEAEEQALAMVDHPNIARVFDAG